MDATRRSFLKEAGALSGAVLGAAVLEVFTAHHAWAAQGQGEEKRAAGPGAGGYRPLRAVADASGQRILALPEGFELVTFGVLGEPLIGMPGVVHARNADGMGAFAGPDGTVRLIRNQELRNCPGQFLYGVAGDARTRYDAKAMGGTTTIDYDPVARRVVREFFSLNGTMVNCSGGLAWRDAGWLTCEETIDGPRAGWERRHGYTFFVPAAANEAPVARPIPAMGRFVKEAAVADPLSGIVYQTEDDGSSSGFYRYLPRDPADLAAGGALQMLKIAGQYQYDARDGQSVGKELKVEWISIEDPDPDLEAGAQRCFAQGYAKGAARFYRLEGIFRGDSGAVLFVSTNGGDVKSGDVSPDGFRTGYGQLWQYTPDGHDGRLTLVYQSTSGAALDSPDNLCITPRGGILFCEDDATPADRDEHALAPRIVNVDRLVGLSREGVPFTFAVNLLNATEFAGACFSPDGTILFVNIFGNGMPGSGMSCAITGPWHEGPL